MVTREKGVLVTQEHIKVGGAEQMGNRMIRHESIKTQVVDLFSFNCQWSLKTRFLQYTTTRRLDPLRPRKQTNPIPRLLCVSRSITN